MNLVVKTRVAQDSNEIETVISILTDCLALGTITLTLPALATQDLWEGLQASVAKALVPDVK